jgi:hypothetical protein
MQRALLGVGIIGAAVVAVTLAADAHVAPAVEENNRYIKITPMADRVRLAYTLYVGEIPGRSERRRIDRDGDGELSASEAEAYGQSLAAAVTDADSVDVDGVPRTLNWDQVDVGLGTPSVNAGAFSIDLIAWLCLGHAGDRGDHSIVLHDRYQPDRPGETELRVEESPGVQVMRSSLGAEGVPSQLSFRWVGGDSPVGSLGYHLRFRIDPRDALEMSDGRCGGSEAGRSRRRPRSWTGLAVIGALAALASIALVWRARRKL